MEKIVLRQQRSKGLSKKAKNKIRIIILNILVALSVLNILSFFVLIDRLSTDGLILAAIINIPSAVFLIMMCLANDVLTIPRKPEKRPAPVFYNITVDPPKKKTKSSSGPKRKSSDVKGESAAKPLDQI